MTFLSLPLVCHVVIFRRRSHLISGEEFNPFEQPFPIWPQLALRTNMAIERLTRDPKFFAQGTNFGFNLSHGSQS